MAPCTLFPLRLGGLKKEAGSTTKVSPFVPPRSLAPVGGWPDSNPKRNFGRPKGCAQPLQLPSKLQAYKKQTFVGLGRFFFLYVSVGFHLHILWLLSSGVKFLFHVLFLHARKVLGWGSQNCSSFAFRLNTNLHKRTLNKTRPQNSLLRMFLNMVDPFSVGMCREAEPAAPSSLRKKLTTPFSKKGTPNRSLVN